MTKPSLKDLWDSGRSTLGAWCFMPGAVQAEAFSSIGFDYVAIDAQHGLIDEDMTLRMLQAVDNGPAIPVVRVPSKDPVFIGKVLDFGAAAVIVPMINTADDVKAAVSACRYGPVGTRSYGPIRAGLRDGPTYFDTANARISVVPMIETKDALDNLEEILAVPGVDAVYIGPSDLAINLGLKPWMNDGEPEFDAALNRVLEECQHAGVVPAIHSDPKTSEKRLNQGFRMVTCALDLPSLYGGMRSAHKIASAAVDALSTVDGENDAK